jgi:hypothetical protein
MGRGQAWEIGSEVVAKSEEQSRAVLPELLRSPGWINNAHQNLNPFKLALVKTELELCVGRRLLSRV